MKDLMEYIYNTLSKYAETHFEEIKRNEKGEIELDSIKITYSLPSRLQTTDIEVRNELTLNIDIWYKTEHIFEVEDIAYIIDKKLNRRKWVCDDKIALFRRDSSFILNINDENPNIRRKQMNYIITLYNN